MAGTFSTKWKASKSPTKQRNYRDNAPLHIRRKFVSAHLSKELLKKHNVRSIPIIKGDKVKIVRGQHKGRENNVERVNIKNSKIFVTGIELAKKDGSKSMYPLPPSNLVITQLNLDDAKRKDLLERKTNKGKTQKVKDKLKTEKLKTEKETEKTEEVKPVKETKTEEQ